MLSTIWLCVKVVMLHLSCVHRESQPEGMRSHVRRTSELGPAALASGAYLQVVELKVAMSCGGCSGAVKRVLDKMEGEEPMAWECQ